MGNHSVPRNLLINLTNHYWTLEHIINKLLCQPNGRMFFKTPTHFVFAPAYSPSAFLPHHWLTFRWDPLSSYSLCLKAALRPQPASPPPPGQSPCNSNVTQTPAIQKADGQNWSPGLSLDHHSKYKMDARDGCRKRTQEIDLEDVFYRWTNDQNNFYLRLQENYLWEMKRSVRNNRKCERW